MLSLWVAGMTDPTIHRKYNDLIKDTSTDPQKHWCLCQKLLILTWETVKETIHDEY